MFRFHLWFIVVVLMGGVLAAGYFFGFGALETQSRQAAVASLREAASRAEVQIRQIGDQQAGRASKLASRAGLPDELLPLAAGTGNPLAARDRIKAALERARPAADMLVVADSRGAVLLRSKAAGDDLTISWLREVLQGLPRAELVSYRGSLFHVAAAPVLSGGRVVGALALGRRVNAAWIERLGADSRNGVTVVLGNKIVATNLDLRQRGELERQLGGLKSGSARELTLGGSTFLGYRWSGGGLGTAAVLHLRSQQAAMSAFFDLRLMYLYVAGGAFLLALFWGFLAHRSFTRNLTVLRERVADPKAAVADPVSAEGLSAPFGGVVDAINQRLSRSRASGVAAPVEPAPVPVVVAAPTEEVETLDEEIPEPPVVEANAAQDSADVTAPATVDLSPAPPLEAETPRVQPLLLQTDEEPGTIPGIGSPDVTAERAAAPAEPAPPPPVATSPDQMSDTLRGVGVPTEPAGPTPVADAATERTVIAAPPEALLRPPPADPLDAVLPGLHESFVAARQHAAEATDGVTLERFAAKLRARRDELRAQYQCRDVDFEVYVRGDGRAGVKAFPRGKIEGSPPPS